MAFMKLCSDDPFIAELRGIFKMNVLRVPEDRIKPLSLLSSAKGAVTYLGSVASMLEGPQLEIPASALKESAVASLSNRRSKSVESKFGIEILSGLLAGMSEGSSPNISAHLKEQQALRFHFPNIHRHYVDIARIGQLLENRTFDCKNLLFGTLMSPKSAIRLVDSVLMSTDLEVEAGDEGEIQLKIDAPSLANALVNGKIEVTQSDDRRIRFRSRRALTFAFTCVNVGVTQSGAIRAISPSNDKLSSPQLANQRGEDRGLDTQILLTRKPELIEVS